MNSNLQDILVVDDSAEIRTLLARKLKAAGFRVRTAADGKEALQAIEYRCPYFVIADWRMSPIDGIELCRRIRLKTLPHYVYVILLSTQPDRNDVATGHEAGADDFASKPVHERELLARLETGARVLELEQRLNQLASVDPLTGVLNRRMGLQLLDKEWSRVVRYGNSLSCVMWDLDHFKPINDTYGHLAGDEVLRATAKLAETISRHADYLYRWGGDEFLMIMPETTEKGALCWTQRFSSEIANLDFCFKGHKIPVTASFGVAERLKTMQGPMDILAAADQAMYLAKRAGRQQIVVSRIIRDTPAEEPVMCGAEDQAEG